MKKVNIIGEYAIYRFRNDKTGEIVKEYSTDVDYNARFLEATNPPTKKGHTWVNADRATKYDSENGEVNIDEYGETGDKEGIVTFVTEGRIRANKKDIKDLKKGKKVKGMEKLKKKHLDFLKGIPDNDLE